MPAHEPFPDEREISRVKKFSLTAWQNLAMPSALKKGALSTITKARMAEWRGWTIGLTLGT